MQVTANGTRKWLAVVVCAISMTPAMGASQNQTRNRDARRAVLAPLLNIYTEQQSRTRLGLYLDADQSRRFDRDGALITRVMRDSPAEEAGLQGGDVVTVFEGQVLTLPFTDADLERDLDLDRSLPAQRLLVLARDLEPGQTVEIRYLRDGANNMVSVEAEEFEFPEVRTFGVGPGSVWDGRRDGNRWSYGLDGNFSGELADRLSVIGDRLADIQFRSPGAFNFSFGITTAEGVEFLDLNPELGEYFGSDTGVLVVEVDEDSTLGLMAGDVVLAVGAREAETVGRVLRLIRSYDEDEPIRFTIIRRGSELVVEGHVE